MGDLMKPSVETRQPKSQASPLADNVLAWLMQAFSGQGPESEQDRSSRVLRAARSGAATGGFRGLRQALGEESSRGPAFTGTVPDLGSGLTPMTQEAGSNISDFINNTKSIEAFNELLGPLRASFGRETQKGEAAIKESLGATGNRFSSSTAKTVGDFRGERENDIGSLIADMFLRNQSNLLGGIQTQQAFGNQNIQPFLDFAGLGILPEQTIVGDSPFSQVANPIAAGLSAFNFGG